MNKADPKKFRVKSFGCQMNVYDGERMNEMLVDQGMTRADEGEDADLVVLNTCHIREKAAEKVYSDIGRLRKKDGSTPMIAVAGCVAQAEGKEISRRAPTVDIVVGPQAYHRLPELIARAKTGRKALDTDMPANSKFDVLPVRQKQARPNAFLTVQEGCDKFCAFCVVPYTRGAEFSRPVDQIIQEAKNLVAGGVREITLLGQNVNAYHGEGADGKDWSLGRLIYALAGMEGVERLRYTTSHPRDMDEELIRAHGEVEALMPYLHLPVQSGSDTILAAMNRQHDAASYLRIIERIRSARPDIALSSDFIVGFPGETDQDFEDTLALVDEVGYAQAYSFKYSPRPGTPAAGDTVQVPEAVKSERLARLQEKLNVDQLAFNKSCEGRTMSVLLDRRGKKDGQLVGRSPYLQSVYVNAPEALFGHFADVKIDTGFANSLSAILVSNGDLAADGTV